MTSLTGEEELGVPLPYNVRQECPSCKREVDVGDLLSQRRRCESFRIPGGDLRLIPPANREQRFQVDFPKTNGKLKLNLLARRER